MNLNKYEHRIRYSDTDHGQVAYYGRYLEWLEAGRSEILRENGATYSEFEKQGIIAPVVHVEIDYKKSPSYDDIIIVETKIEKIGNTSITFVYEIKNKKDNSLLATAKTVNVFVNSKEKVPVPEKIRKILES